MSTMFRACPSLRLLTVIGLAWTALAATPRASLSAPHMTLTDMDGFLDGFLSIAAGDHNALAIIVNRQNHTTQLSITDLRRIFLGEMTRWPDGTKVTVVSRAPGEQERDALLRLVCHMSERDFTRYQLQAEFRGQLEGTQKLLTSPTGVRRFVFNVPGAIGYVRGDEVDETIRVLRIAGAGGQDPSSGMRLQAQ